MNKMSKFWQQSYGLLIFKDIVTLVASMTLSYAQTFAVSTQRWSLNFDISNKSINKLWPREHGICNALTAAVHHPKYHAAVKDHVEHVHWANRTNKLASFVV